MTECSARKSRKTLAEVQLTPGLGRRAGGAVNRRTPLRRAARVKPGVCGEAQHLRTPRMPELTRKRRLRSSTVEEVHVQLPLCGSASPAPVVIKSNPLYSLHTRNTSQQPLSMNKTSEGKVSTPCDGGRNPLFYGQRRKIRKTKEEEMISAIMDLVEYGDRSVGKTQKKSVISKAKALLKKRKSSDITKTTSKKGAFFLKARK